MAAETHALPVGHELIEGHVHHAVTVYGTPTCGDTTRTRRVLEDEGIEYNFYNIDLDDAMRRTAESLAEGSTKIPVVNVGEGIVLVEPSDDDLRDALKKTGRLP